MVMDRSNKRRQASGERCGSSKLKRHQVQAIRILCAGGYTYKTLAKMFNTSISNVGDIIGRKIWI